MFIRTSAPKRGARGDAERRRSGRFRTEFVSTSLGRVLDLSANGARIDGWRPRRGIVKVTIPAGGQPIILSARVRWSRGQGWFQHQCGLEFLGLNDQQRQQLKVMALNC